MFSEVYRCRGQYHVSNFYTTTRFNFNNGMYSWKKKVKSLTSGSFRPVNYLGLGIVREYDKYHFREIL